MTNVNPNTGLSSRQTIFPRINFIKNRDARLLQRGLNGRVFKDGFTLIDNKEVYPPLDGSLSFEDALPLPIDLGPDVSTTPTTVYDLREDDGTPRVFDLGPLNYDIDTDYIYPPDAGSLAFSSALPFPIDLGADVSVAPTGVLDLRRDDDDTTYDLN